VLIAPPFSCKLAESTVTWRPMLETDNRDSVRTIRSWAKEIKDNRKAMGMTPFDISEIWPTVIVPDFTRLSGVSKWLNDHIGYENYLWSCEYFWFTKEADAVLFKLTWYEQSL
jgi:hypothetical protein